MKDERLESIGDTSVYKRAPNLQAMIDFEASRSEEDKTKALITGKREAPKARVLSLLPSERCNMYLQNQNVPDYFGKQYVHAFDSPGISRA